jgi:hypothetical protein
VLKAHRFLISFDTVVAVDLQIVSNAEVTAVCLAGLAVRVSDIVDSSLCSRGGACL